MGEATERKAQVGACTLCIRVPRLYVALPSSTYDATIVVRVLGGQSRQVSQTESGVGVGASGMENARWLLRLYTPRH